MKNDNTVKVDWSKVAPLDIELHRNGRKPLKSKVQVRAIVGDECIEQMAGLEPGALRRLMDTVTKLARHGYEARIADSLRFVHMYTRKGGVYLSPQLLKPYKDEVLKDVNFRLIFDGQTVDGIEQAEDMRHDEIGPEEVTPDPIIHCPRCRYEIRVGRRNVPTN